ncbi:hypothetical protein [Tenacibaculum xiamenense]|uniref:hypothetical protein n=1 Tax=Tenacibaculum xiamenense TaxID=1261553 RepID=UPI0038940600
MIDRKITEWLFYVSENNRAIGKSSWDDPKWRDLFFPNKKVFCNQVLESSLDDFVRTLVWIFKDRFPVEFGSFKTSMYGLDDEGVPSKEQMNRRKLQDIKPMIVEMDDDYWAIQSVKIEFKKQQPEVFSWIESELVGKGFSKQEKELVTYNVMDSPISHIEVTEEAFTIHINQERVVINTY